MAFTRKEAALVKGMLDRGDKQSDIAAFFGVNIGRVCEVNTGRKWPDVRAHHSDLPPPGPYMAARSAYRMKQALERAKMEIDAALLDIACWEAADGDDN